jgi:sugar (pentulose or hexulose) kinase
MDTTEPLILTADFGTQSVRVGLYGPLGEEIAIEKTKYDPPYFSALPNYAEQEPDYYYRAFCEASQRLALSQPGLLRQVRGLTLTSFRDSAVLLDEDLKPIRPMILWLDQRTAECKKPLPFFSRVAFRLVGMTDTVTFNRKRSVSNWIIEKEQENWAKIKKYVNISTYLNYLLTGALKDSSSNLAAHYPLNYKKRDWYARPEKQLKGQIFSLTKDKLPEIAPEGSIIGWVTDKAAAETGLPAGLPLYASGSDKSCETLGLGVLDESLAAISYGTASSVETTRRRYTESERFLPGFPSCIPGYFNMDIQVYRGYWMINWFLKEFGGRTVNDIVISDIDAADFNAKLSQVPPGCDGLVLQPYWGPGLSRPLAKGAIIGFSDSITQEHFYRAIIEGIAYALREGLEHFERKLHRRIPELRVSGGGSQSEAICQITADIFNRPGTRVQTSETSSLGAAIAGYLALGVYATPEEAVRAMVHPKDAFRPNAENAAQYDYLFKNAYAKMYPALKGIYKSIKDFNKNQEKELRRKKLGEALLRKNKEP